jgi:uncharacterized cupredoxin-like copper-binding protein
MRRAILALPLAAIFLPPPAIGHEATHAATHTPAQHHAALPFGKAGDPEAITRTVTLRMSDRMRFEPAALSVRRGETVRFVLKNEGKLMHEMVLGTSEGLRAHAEEMKKQTGMHHAAPYMMHVAPGKTGEIVWQFTEPGEFQFACLIPGHFEAGMVGQVKVK